MAFADPLSITFPAPLSATISLPKTSFGLGVSEYTAADGSVVLTAASQKTGKGRIRRTLRIDHQKYAASPLIPSNNVLNSMSNYMVFDVPVGGYTNAEVLAVYKGFNALYTAGTDLLITKLLGGES